MAQGGEREIRSTRLLSAGEVARMLNLSRLHIQTLAVSRELPGIWMENTLLFRIQDVQEYMRIHRGQEQAIA